MNIELLNSEEWVQYLRKCPSSTFFHTPMWYEVWEKYSKNKSYCNKYIFKSGNTAVFPYAYSYKAKKTLRQLVSSPVGTYGGIVSATGLSPEEVKILGKKIFKAKCILIRNNPFDTSVQLSSKSYHEDFTQVFEITAGNLDFKKKWTKGHRSAVNKGKREGITVHIAKREEWPEYYKLYNETIGRWNNNIKYPYRLELFNYLSQLNDENQKLWIAKYNNDIVAGAICFYFNKHVVYWHGAASQRFFKFRPVHVLIDHIINDALLNNYRWFDFNPSSGLEGVIKFKKGFGTEKLRSDILRKESLSYQLISKLISLVR